MIQDIILNLKSDNNDFKDIILNLKSDNNDFDLRGRTSNDTTMNHISDIQQCDHMHGTMGGIGINTVGILGNGDDQAITARDGERISSSCVMTRTKDKLVYDYNNPARIRIKSSIGNVSYIYSTSSSTSSQHTTRTTSVIYITIMSISDRKDVNSTTHVTLHQNLNLNGMHIRRHHTGDDNNGLDNVMYTISEVNNDSNSTSDDNVDTIKPSTTSTSKEKEIMNGEVEIDCLHPEASTLATRSTDMRVNIGEGYTSVTINRMNPPDLCILYAVMTRSNILWKLTLVIKRRSLRSWGASKIYPDGGHWTNQLTHVTKCQVEWLGSVTETHSMGYMWKDKRIPYWWLRNGELWSAAFGSFFCAYNNLE